MNIELRRDLILIWITRSLSHSVFDGYRKVDHSMSDPLHRSMRTETIQNVRLAIMESRQQLISVLVTSHHTQPLHSLTYQNFCICQLLLMLHPMLFLCIRTHSKWVGFRKHPRMGGYQDVNLTTVFFKFIAATVRLLHSVFSRWNAVDRQFLKNL